MEKMCRKMPNIEQPGFCQKCNYPAPGHFLECSDFERPKDDKEYIDLLDKELSSLINNLHGGTHKDFTFNIEKRIEKLNKILDGLLKKLKETESGDDKWLKEMEERRKSYEHQGDFDHWEAQRQERKPLPAQPIEEVEEKIEPVKVSEELAGEKKVERPKLSELSEAQEKIKNIFLEKLRANYNFATDGGKKSLTEVLKETKTKGRSEVEKHRSSFLNALVVIINEIYSDQKLGKLEDKRIAIKSIIENLEKEFDSIAGKITETDAENRKRDIATVRTKIKDSWAERDARTAVRFVINTYENRTEEELIRLFSEIRGDNIIKIDNTTKRRACSYFIKDIERLFPKMDSKTRGKISKALAAVVSRIDWGRKK